MAQQATGIAAGGRKLRVGERRHCGLNEGQASGVGWLNSGRNLLGGTIRLSCRPRKMGDSLPSRDAAHRNDRDQNSNAGIHVLHSALAKIEDSAHGRVPAQRAQECGKTAPVNTKPRNGWKGQYDLRSGVS
jgi:hypothetical protein